MRVLPLAANAAAIAIGLAAGAALREVAVGAEAPVVAAPAAAKAAEADAAPARARFAFRRPFIVPVAEDWRTQSLVVLTVELSLTPEDGEAMGRVLEARLRDRIMPTLLGLGQAGAFAAMPPEPGAVEAAIGEAVAPLLRAPPTVTVTDAEKRRL